MAHANKSKAKGISSSSFLDLKAELSKQEVEFTKAKAAGKGTSVVGGVPRPEKKPTVWARQNKGVKSRANRDIELEEISRPTLESARAVLERKAKIYEKLRKGKSGGLDEKQYESLLVDFDSAPALSKYYEDDEDDDESANVPAAPLADDPIVEYEDEFGRLRTARRSEVPRELLHPTAEEDEDEDLVIRNPVNYFPVYQPSEERLANIAKAEAESFKPLNVHYDASREVRAQGAGFYQFSGDEETRRAQMEELKSVREETARTRQETGAEDAKIGDIEGMREAGPSTSSAQSKAVEKRKREIEERRKLVEAKRRKLQPPRDQPQTTQQSEDSPTDTVRTNSRQSESEEKPSTSSVDPFSALEATSTTTQNHTKSSPPDPFAALDTKQAPIRAATSAQAKPIEADTFLAELEREFIGEKTKKRR